ncbi:MAG: enoyl-CoA hydratase/isomerase family protein [Candidatus Lambdaproteobacteria bacterium]|nr:enoyl-CoA hydratase/isomerase family protein [Candidatus Lambdaproteobacteria bacterium]
MTAYQSIDVVSDGPVATLRLNRPAQYNALDERLALELDAALGEIAAAPALRALVLTGAGEAFCAGGDVKGFLAAGEGVADHIARLVPAFHGALLRLVRLPIPVLAAVNGVAAGAGMSLALACDLVLAREDARFAVAYGGIGATPDGGCTWFLPRIVGLRRAMELIATNRTLSAQEALAWGLANRLAGADAFAAETRALAAQLAQAPTLAVGRAKALLLASSGGEDGLAAHLDREAQAIVASARSADFREGLRAFAGKRPARFEGR